MSAKQQSKRTRFHNEAKLARLDFARKVEMFSKSVISTKVPPVCGKDGKPFRTSVGLQFQYTGPQMCSNTTQWMVRNMFTKADMGSSLVAKIRIQDDPVKTDRFEVKNEATN